MRCVCCTYCVIAAFPKCMNCRPAANTAEAAPPLIPRPQVIIEKYYNRLTQDFDTNKRVCEEIAVIQSKRLRNKIAGFSTVMRHGLSSGLVSSAELAWECSAWREACSYLVPSFLACST